MVFYECFITAKNTANFDGLTSLMKKISLQIVENGGVVRGIHNHGLREFPNRIKAKFPDARGDRYFRKGRYISVYYDSNPSTMRQVEGILIMDEQVIRNTHLKARSVLDTVNITRENRNPFIKQAIRHEEEMRVMEKVKNETIEQIIEDMRSDNGA